jgi:phosphoglycolate phosphatase
LIQAVVFDLDGTLLDTEPDFTLILNTMLAAEARAPVSANTVRKFVSAGAAAVVRQGFELTVDDPRVPKLLEDFLERYSRQIPHTLARLFADVEFVLAALTARTMRWGIMTNKARRFSEPLLKHFNAFSGCSTLVCPDDVGKKGKPNPAGLLLACKQLQLPPQEVLYVGDHPRDIEAAKNAGMPGVAVAWGYLPDGQPITSWGAQYIAAAPRDLLRPLALG